MTEVNLEKLRGDVEILRWCKQQQAKIKDAERNARTAIEDVMGDADVGLLDGEPAVHWPHFKEARFDTQAFREDHPELWETYKAARGKRRFEIVE